MDNEVDELRSEIRGLRDDIKKMSDALLGTPFTNNRGIVSIMEDHETRIIEIETKFIKNKWLIIGLSAGTGVGSAAILKSIIETFATILHK